MSNLEIWDKVKRPPTTALKPIQFGRLKGKSDINPQWRMQIMTEVFGPCGKGWKYTIDKLWTEPGTEGQVFAFAQISLFAGGDLIPGIGGSMLLALDKNGLHHNDEAFKMATTDALSVAMKALGVAGDIYLGLWDGSKYATQQNLKHNPNDGAGESLTTNRRNYLSDIAVEIKDAYDQGDFKAMSTYINEIKELDEELFLWSLLDSKIRATSKAYDQITKAQTEEELKRAWESSPKHAHLRLATFKDQKKALLTKEKEAA